MAKTRQEKITRGVQARQVLESMSGRFGKLQAMYLSQLMTSVRKGEDPTSAAYKLTALDDLVQDLTSDEVTGAREEQRRERELLSEVEYGENDAG